MDDAPPLIVHVELLVGRRVVDPNGTPIGRIEEVVAVREGGECYVTEFHLGSGALLERLAIAFGGIVSKKSPRRLIVPWDQMDLTDPIHPSARRPKSELETR